MLKTTDSQMLTLVEEGTAELGGRPGMLDDDYEILAISQTLMLLYFPGYLPDTKLKIVPRSEVEDAVKK